VYSDVVYFLDPLNSPATCGNTLSLRFFLTTRTARTRKKERSDVFGENGNDKPPFIDFSACHLALPRTFQRSIPARLHRALLFVVKRFLANEQFAWFESREYLPNYSSAGPFARNRASLTRRRRRSFARVASKLAASRDGIWMIRICPRWAARAKDSGPRVRREPWPAWEKFRAVRETTPLAINCLIDPVNRPNAVARESL